MLDYVSLTVEKFIGKIWFELANFWTMCYFYMCFYFKTTVEWYIIRGLWYFLSMNILDKVAQSWQNLVLAIDFLWTEL